MNTVDTDGTVHVLFHIDLTFPIFCFMVVLTNVLRGLLTYGV